MSKEDKKAGGSIFYIIFDLRPLFFLLIFTYITVLESYEHIEYTGLKKMEALEQE